MRPWKQCFWGRQGNLDGDGGGGLSNEHRRAHEKKPPLLTGMYFRCAESDEAHTVLIDDHRELILVEVEVHKLVIS